MHEVVKRFHNPEEDKRIAAWRAERARVAEQQKIERVQQRQYAKEEENTKKIEARREQALQLIPTRDEMIAVQTEIRQGKRRARRTKRIQFTAFLLAPLTFVFLYMSLIATPLYEAQTSFLVPASTEISEQTEGTFSGISHRGTNYQLGRMAQSYIESQALMELLLDDGHISQQFLTDEIDPIRRIWSLPYFPLSERQQFDRFLFSQVDVETGMVTLYVRTKSPKNSEALSIATISLLEQQISEQQSALQTSRINRAEQVLTLAEQKLTSAQSELNELRLSSGIFDPDARIDSVQRSIRILEEQTYDLDQQIRLLRITGRTNSHQYTQLTEVRDELDVNKEQLQQSIVSDASFGGFSRAHERISARLELARNRYNLALAAWNQVQSAQLNPSQTISIIVPTRAAGSIASPNIVGSILFAMLVFGALYQFVRLTFRKSAIG